MDAWAPGCTVGGDTTRRLGEQAAYVLGPDRAAGSSLAVNPLREDGRLALLGVITSSALVPVADHRFGLPDLVGPVEGRWLDGHVPPPSGDVVVGLGEDETDSACSRLIIKTVAWPVASRSIAWCRWVGHPHQ